MLSTPLARGDFTGVHVVFLCCFDCIVPLEQCAAHSFSPRSPQLEFLEEVGGLLAGIFGVVDRDLGRLLCSFGYVFAGVGGGVA